MGSFKIVNNTAGFHFSADNPYDTLQYGLFSKVFHNGLTPGYLTYNGDRAERPLNAAVIYVYSGSDARSFGGYNSSMFNSDNVLDGIEFISPKMSSDTWGPRKFVIFIPEAKTPNQPNGYESLNNLVWSNCSAAYSIDDFLSRINTGDYTSRQLKKILSN